MTLLFEYALSNIKCIFCRGGFPKVVIIIGVQAQKDVEMQDGLDMGTEHRWALEAELEVHELMGHRAR